MSENKNIQYPESELVIGEGNTVYHLNVARKNVASTIILVGDQDRVPIVSKHFETITHRSQNREFVIHSGTYKGKEISVVSTGIGTDNIDIVINELDALFNIDFDTRQDNKEHTSLKLIRIGTCGILQPEIPLHSFIITHKAFGLDNVAHFYEIDFSDEEEDLRKQLVAHLQIPDKIRPYLATCSESLFKTFLSKATYQGITITSSGFYGPQGRKLRLPIKIGNIYELLSTYHSKEGEKVLNFEMETSAFYALGRALGHKCITICLGAANRPNKTFSDNYHPHMESLIKYVLDRL